MVELKQKIRKGDRLLWRIVNLPDIHPEPPKQDRKGKQAHKGLKKGNAFLAASCQKHQKILQVATLD